MDEHVGAVAVQRASGNAAGENRSLEIILIEILVPAHILHGDELERPVVGGCRVADDADVDGGVGAGTGGRQSLHVGCSMLMVIREAEGNGSVVEENGMRDSLTSCLVAGGGRLHMWDQE